MTASTAREGKLAKDVPIPEKIFVAISVANPEKLTPLAGATTAALRMARWARRMGYLVVPVHDADGEVTISLLQRKIVEAIELVQQEKVLRRIVVFFAGHGGTKDIEEPYWLLSNWWSQPQEAVDIIRFRRMLRYYAPIQVTLIGDACQVVDKAFLELKGSGVLDRKDEDNPFPELDQFFAADAGEEAFMIKSRSADGDFCIFTEVLLDALEGDAPNAFDQHRQGDPVVTSTSLARYLQEQIPIEAGRHNVSMKPWPVPGFFTDTVYAQFPSGLGTDGLDVPIDCTDAGPRAGELIVTDMDDQLGPKIDFAEIKAQKQSRAVGIFRDLIFTDTPNYSISGSGLVVIGLKVAAIHGGGYEADPGHHGAFRLYLSSEPNNLSWKDYVVELVDGRCVYVCGVQWFMAKLFVHEHGEISLVHRHISEKAKPAPVVSGALADLAAGRIGRVSAVDLAAQVRRGKHLDYTLGLLAAYLYNAIGDIDGIRSIAWYYHREGQVIPLDIALLTGGKLHMGDDGTLTVDIPATQKRKPRTDVEDGLAFTTSATSAVSGAAVGGRAPWLRSGWRAIETALLHESAEEWRQCAMNVVPHLTEGQFLTVRPEGKAALLKLIERARSISMEMVRDA
ncbi:hypothetical protein KRR38_01335 [Novosphingobium sp. G106]|uniref:hypothetical protein n=1 Tax=Novosphingobium sp. G106 TaxID=2849500 RepID=UPI001C2D5B16|nr:hypothetical protein [Novosphingobium sp. G106]MBV1686347.1 hypothetical protein [Novosphingobium sp. G106]